MTNLATAQDKTNAYLKNSKAANTLIAYKSDWQSFVTYCQSYDLCPLPSNETTLASYITYMADNHKTSTIVRHMASIGQAHVTAGYPDVTKVPIIRTLLQGIKRTNKCLTTKAEPLLLPDIHAIVDSLDSSLVSLRNKAILLIGFATGCRRSELADLRMEDISFNSSGLMIIIRQSKADQEGHGYTKAIPYGSTLCPIQALNQWITEAKICDGHVFRCIGRYGNIGGKLSGKAIAKIIKSLADNAGLQGKFSGHSLRSGLVTTCANLGMAEYEIMQQTGHKSANVLRGYIQQANLFRNNVVSKIGM